MRSGQQSRRCVLAMRDARADVDRRPAAIDANRGHRSTSSVNLADRHARTFAGDCELDIASNTDCRLATSASMRR